MLRLLTGHSGPVVGAIAAYGTLEGVFRASLMERESCNLKAPVVQAIDKKQTF